MNNTLEESLISKFTLDELCDFKGVMYELNNYYPDNEKTIRLMNLMNDALLSSNEFGCKYEVNPEVQIELINRLTYRELSLYLDICHAVEEKCTIKNIKTVIRYCYYKLSELRFIAKNKTSYQVEITMDEAYSIYATSNLDPYTLCINKPEDEITEEDLFNYFNSSAKYHIRKRG